MVRVVHRWNQMPIEVVSLPSLAVFKKLPVSINTQCSNSFLGEDVVMYKLSSAPRNKIQIQSSLPSLSLAT